MVSYKFEITLHTLFFSWMRLSPPFSLKICSIFSLPRSWAMWSALFPSYSKGVWCAADWGMWVAFTVWSEMCMDILSVWDGWANLFILGVNWTTVFNQFLCNVNIIMHGSKVKTCQSFLRVHIEHRCSGSRISILNTLLQMYVTVNNLHLSLPLNSLLVDSVSASLCLSCGTCTPQEVESTL